jgi:hypothetical protein
LRDGRILIAHRDDDSCGIALLTPMNTQEFVLRAAQSGGEVCLALVERFWPPGAPLTSPAYRPTDFTAGDLTQQIT